MPRMVALKSWPVNPGLASLSVSVMARPASRVALWLGRGIDALSTLANPLVLALRVVLTAGRRRGLRGLLRWCRWVPGVGVSRSGIPAGTGRSSERGRERRGDARRVQVLPIS